MYSEGHGSIDIMNHLNKKGILNQVVIIKLTIKETIKQVESNNYFSYVKKPSL